MDLTQTSLVRSDAAVHAAGGRLPPQVRLEHVLSLFDSWQAQKEYRGAQLKPEHDGLMHQYYLFQACITSICLHWC